LLSHCQHLNVPDKETQEKIKVGRRIKDE
jgi:hypothetical protein